MDNKSFDHIIKAKLENLTSDATPRWDLFKEKKSVHDAMRADTAFDNSIRRTVSEYSAPYNPNHWSLLKARLERIYGLRKALYSIRIYELLAVVVLFYSVNSNYNSLFGPDSALNIKTSQPIALTNDQVAISETNNSAYTPAKSFDATTINPSIDEVEVVSTNSISNSTKDVINRILASNVGSSNISKNNSNNNIQNNIVAFDNPLLSDNNKAQSVVNEDLVDETVAIADASVSDASLSLQSISAITSMIDSKTRHVSILTDNFGIKPVNKVSNDSKWLQVAASFDNNKITTPYNEIFDIDSDSGEMFGYSLSGLFSIEKGNVEYETGLTYSVYNKPLTFRMPWDNNIGDVFMYSLTNVNYDILSVPLRAKYHFATTPDWSLYVTGGVSPEFIVNTGYDENDVSLNINAPTPVGGNPNPELLVSPFRSESNFHQGLFEQGSFQDNFMLRAQIGAGMQRNITPTLSAFIAGDYYTSIINKTYGPTNDKINKFSITFGVKERF